MVEHIIIHHVLEKDEKNKLKQNLRKIRTHSTKDFKKSHQFMSETYKYSMHTQRFIKP